MRRLTAAIAWVTVATLSTPSAAEDAATSGRMEQVEQTLKRLELTAEQSSPVEAVLLRSAAAREEILVRYELDPASLEGSAERPGLRTLRAMRKEMEAVRKDTLEALEPLLNDRQFEALERIQEERRAEMRAKIRG